MPTYIELKEVPPQCIARNPENPREVFPAGPLQELQESIDSRGILVPLYVYETYEEPDGETESAHCEERFVLVDGERRWICANKLGLDSVPVIVGPKPSDEENIISMFHIHRVREQWHDIPTAHALAKVRERTGKGSPADLADITGLKEEQVKRYLYAVELPAEYQQLIAENLVPLNFFYELKRNVLDALRTKRPALLAEIGEDTVMRVFVEKKTSGVTSDSIELRLVKPIIQVAEREAGGTEKSSPLDQDLRILLTDAKQPIKETYENTVELTIESDKFGKECTFLLRRYDWLIDKAGSEEERQMIKGQVAQLIDSLQERLERRG